MMKFVTTDMTALSLRHGEQYDNCSELLIEPEMTSLEELDPAILSCGLPAIVLNDEDLATTTVTTTTPQPLPSSLMGSCFLNGVTSAATTNFIRYTVAHLLALRKSPLSHRRPGAIDDPRTAPFPIWSRFGFGPQQEQQQQQQRVRRISDEEYGGGAYGGGGRKPNDRQRDNGFYPPRFRRNHEFSNRNHHVIVKSYSPGEQCAVGVAGGGYNPMRLQETIIEEEPEWVTSGPTSRLDTIELRGFDEDMTRNVSESLKTSPGTLAKQRGAFFDELLHYEHVHPKHAGAKHDTSGGAVDGESVSTSNTASPPPARSTPTKYGADMNNNAYRKVGSCTGSLPGSSTSGGGVNVSNFEELMKLDSILGDSADSNSSRLSKCVRRGGGPSGTGSILTGGGSNGHHYQHHYQQSQHQQHHVRFALDRNTHHYNNSPQNRQAGSGRLPISALQHPPTGVDPSKAGTTPAADTKSFQRLLDMMAVQNQRMHQQHQQQYLLQLLQNSQQTETLRQMLMKKCSFDNAAAAAAATAAAISSTGGGQQRIPTQAELQLHTQSIMKQALLRKKIAEQSRLLLEQQGGGGGVEQEPIPAVQKLLQSFCPNVQHRTGGSIHQQQQGGADGRSGSHTSGEALFAAAAAAAAASAAGNRGITRASITRRY
uniref:Uncharacterized protein n=1 Tax=Anopheles farauti TaxID=69004 RepID=A0A182Q4U2_9DIPT